MAAREGGLVTMDIVLLTILTLLGLALLTVVGLAIDRYRQRHAHR